MSEFPFLNLIRILGSILSLEEIQTFLLGPEMVDEEGKTGRPDPYNIIFELESELFQIPGMDILLFDVLKKHWYRRIETQKDSE